ncbi:hypothetical protein ACJX0J_038001, partial [Zea mays]
TIFTCILYIPSLYLDMFCSMFFAHLHIIFFISTDDLYLVFLVIMHESKFSWFFNGDERDIHNKPFRYFLAGIKQKGFITIAIWLFMTGVWGIIFLHYLH